MNPFNHIRISDFEAILLYKNKQERIFDNGYDEWHALDMYGNKICISRQYMCLINSGEPSFYREKRIKGKWMTVKIPNEHMRTQITSGSTCGKFMDTGTVWEWDLEKLSLWSNNECWMMRIMTPGGFWI
tara:strand:- start:310 stop:696 length:387 start_codon:yes stop_codon:yes gene_type:complete